MMKSRSDYIYQIAEINNKKVIMIIDLNLGRMSVTNNIEHVVEEICSSSNLDPSDCLIVYKDSEGRIDSWDHNSQSFVMLHERFLKDRILLDYFN